MREELEEHLKEIEMLRQEQDIAIRNNRDDVDSITVELGDLESQEVDIRQKI